MVVAFEVETAGHMDRDAEVYLHCDVPGDKSKIEQSILVRKGNGKLLLISPSIPHIAIRCSLSICQTIFVVMEMQQYLTKQILFEG